MTPGVAPVEEAVAEEGGPANPGPAGRRLSVTRSSACSDHAVSASVPWWPLVLVAFAAWKPTVPKSASGSVRHTLSLVQADGASTIQSAEVMSMSGAVRVLVKDVPR